MKSTACLAILIGLSLIGGCNWAQGQIRSQPIKIIFDTDMGSDCDDAGALALLHAYADMGRVRIIGTGYSSGKVPYGAGVVQAINIYYGRGDTPVGAYHGDDIGDPVDKMKAEELAKDTERFGNTIVHNKDAEEITRLNRKLLVAQEDDSVVYLTVGHTKGLHDLLVSRPDDVSPLSGRELVKKKITRWIALGALFAINEEGSYRKDWNFSFNDTAPYTKYLVDNFPKPMVFVTAGTDILTGKSLKQTPPGNIVRTAYTEWLTNYSQKTLDDQRPSWDLIAVYYAVEGLGDYLVEAPNGFLDFDIEKGSRWIQSKRQSGQTILIQKKNIKQPFSRYLNQMISLPPRQRQ